MPDILASAGAAFTLAKQLVTLSKTIQNAELQNAIADLTLQLADLKVELANLVTENADLKAKLKAKGDAPSLTFRDGYYYGPDDEHPYCPGCYDDKKKVIRLSKTEGMLRKFGKYICPTCDKSFG